MKSLHRVLMLVSMIFVLGFCFLSLSALLTKGDPGWEIDLFGYGHGGFGKGIAATPPFIVGERIVLYAFVAYEGMPVQSILVAFQVDNPESSQLIASTQQTNASGYATINFTITENVYPHYPSSWNSVVTTSPSGKTFNDTMPFRVLPRHVGGVSFHVPVLATQTYARIIMINVLIASVLIVFSKTRRKAS